MAAGRARARARDDYGECRILKNILFAFITQHAQFSTAHPDPATQLATDSHVPETCSTDAAADADADDAVAGAGDTHIEKRKRKKWRKATQPTMRLRI